MSSAFNLLFPSSDGEGVPLFPLPASRNEITFTALPPGRWDGLARGGSVPVDLIFRKEVREKTDS